jgi:hypothetical protein
MENVKVLATPKAYNLILPSAEDDPAQKAVSSAVKLALGRLPKLRQIKCPAMAIEKCPLEMTMQWSDKLEEDSVILISHKSEPYFLLDAKLFSDAIKTAIAIAVV